MYYSNIYLDRGYKKLLIEDKCQYDSYFVTKITINNGRTRREERCFNVCTLYLPALKEGCHIRDKSNVVTSDSGSTIDNCIF